MTSSSSDRVTPDLDATPDIWVMQRALRLAEKAKVWAHPNPMVGAVLMKNGERIGEGYHTRFGAAHAEVEAFRACSEAGFDPRGATLFVTLEPCCHHGKTPPCVDAILESGVQRVVIASLDPSEKVAGKGVEKLRAAGLTVEIGLLEAPARELNRAFFSVHEEGRPWITLKMALSLDGKIAAQQGQRTPLTGKLAQRYVHGLRSEHQAILVGAQTVLVDNPHLGVRDVEGRDPLRVIWAPHGDQARERFWETRPQHFQVFRDSHFYVSEAPDLPQLLAELQNLGIISVLVEGGATTWRTFRETGLWDESQLLLAPLFLGTQGVPLWDHDAPLVLPHASSRLLGKDWLLIERRVTPR